MTQCEYRIELFMPVGKGVVIIETSHAKIFIERQDLMTYCVDSYYISTTKKIDCKRLIIRGRNEKILLRIQFDGKDKTNTVYGCDRSSIVTPFYNLDSSQLKYPVFSKGYIKISNIVLPYQERSEIVLYKICQTAPRKLVTPLGAKNLLPFGFDGPHRYETVKNGFLYLENFGYRGTLWFDKIYLKDEQFIRLLQSLLVKDGWEAGLHYSKSLSDESPAEVYRLISDEFDFVSSQLHASPKSWCSLRNKDNVDFANYLFDTYSMIWRNGNSGVHSEPGIGNLEDSSWEWWDLASKAGLIHPAFTHQTDKEIAIPYSISFPKFKMWVDNYRANGISIVPFFEWWQINANTNDAFIKDMSVLNGMLTFTAETNGERALVNVNIAADRDLEVVDNDTRTSVSWSRERDATVSFFVQSDHEYVIFHQKNDRHYLGLSNV